MRKLIVAAVAACSSLITPLGLTAQAAETKPVPIDSFAMRNLVNTVAVSPDGKHLLVMKLLAKGGKYAIDIYSTDDFSKPIRTIGADPMEFFVGSPPRWVSDTVIAGGTWKWVRKRVRGPEDTGWDTLLFSYDIEKNKFRQLENKKTRTEGSGFTILNNLPGEPDEILIATGADVGGELGVDPFARFRPRSYYKYNVKTGGKKLVLKGNEDIFNVTFDGKARPRFAQGVRNGERAFFYRLPDSKDWKEYWTRENGDDYDQMYRILGGIEGQQGWVKDDPTTAMMISNHGGDKAALWTYDLVNGVFKDKIFEAPDADVLGLQGHSNTWGSPDSDVSTSAIIYSGAKRERHWLDMEEKALHEQMESKIPNAYQISITSRSRDGQTMVVQNTGPRDPGSFWFVKDGKMMLVGSRNPLVKAEDLSDVKFIRYPARDGKMIPGYVTIPKGEGPHPLIVLPHGGPHVNEVIVYDEWGQFLANNGYMVLQPQYRMSVGWGKDHFVSAMGQHGFAMQDDKDDGAKYLVEQGMADPNRMAMFGWSYGGYAALVAASREPNIYQCVIAGAAVADPKKSHLQRSRGGSGALKSDMIEDWARARGGFVGINPIVEIDKVNVPVMMVHGKQDARVLYFHFKDYRTEMERVAKDKQQGSCSGGIDDSVCTTTIYRSVRGGGDSVVPVMQTSSEKVGETGREEIRKELFQAKNRFVTLEQADHFSITLMYEHQKKLYTEMLDFLQNDCGPGGL